MNDDGPNSDRGDEENPASLGEAQPMLEATKAQWKEILRRDAELDADPGVGVSW